MLGMCFIDHICCAAVTYVSVEAALLVVTVVIAGEVSLLLGALDALVY